MRYGSACSGWYSRPRRGTYWATCPVSGSQITSLRGRPSTSTSPWVRRYCSQSPETRWRVTGNGSASALLWPADSAGAAAIAGGTGNGRTGSGRGVGSGPGPGSGGTQVVGGAGGTIGAGCVCAAAGPATASATSSAANGEIRRSITTILRRRRGSFVRLRIPQDDIAGAARLRLTEPRAGSSLG